MHSPRWLLVVGAAVFLVPLAPSVACSQDPAPAPAGPAAQPQPPAASSPTTASSSKAKSKYSHAHDFLIRGTVFTPNALAFPRVRLRIRRASEKKFRWDTYTDSRGEFAVRVPQGIQYEMVIAVKGFTDQTRTIDAANGLSEDTVVFRMEPAGGKK
jgi:hypothetical protein